MYPLFINDPNWAKYRDRIVIFEYTPDGNDNSYTVEGVTYSPAAHLLNNLPTEQKAYMAWSLWNLPVQIVKTAVFAALTTATAGAFGAVWGGATLAQGLATAGQLVIQNIVNFSISQFCINLAVGATTTATGIIFSEMGMGYLGSIVNMAVSFGASGIANGISTGIKGTTESFINNQLIGEIAKAGLKTGLKAGFISGGTSLIMPGLSNAMGAAQLAMNSNDPIELETYSKDESADLIGKMDAGGGSFGSWFSGTAHERKVEGIYHMYVKDVDDKTIEANNG